MSVALIIPFLALFHACVARIDETHGSSSATLTDCLYALPTV